MLFYDKDGNEIEIKYIQRLIDSIEDSISIEYQSGHNSGISDRYRCSGCGEEVRCRDVDGMPNIYTFEHDESCSYLIKNKAEKELEMLTDLLKDELGYTE